LRPPKILYHGTTFGRYVMGIHRDGLRGDMPRDLKCDEHHRGFVFLTDSAQEAGQYAMITWFFDKSVPEMNPYSASTKCMILGVQTSKLRKDLVIDSEYYETKEWFEEKGTYDRVQEMFGMGMWYKYKGNISKTRIFVKDFIDITKQHHIVLEELAGFTLARFVIERMGDESVDKIKKALEKLVGNVSN